MFWIAEQIVDLICNGRITWLLIVWFIGFSIYCVFVYWYTKYKVYDKIFRPNISIIVSVFREEPELFRKCLSSIKSQLLPNDEFLIVFDGKDIPLQTIAKEYGEVYVKPHGGKRSTLAYGCNHAKNEIFITVDSDTVLCSTCINEILKPFINPKIGAVSAQSRILNAGYNLTTRIADCHEIIAHDFIQKATSANGNVSVLYGRCLSIRRSIWETISKDYETKLFRGKKIESGDDNDITILTMKAGYNTFMQHSAKSLSVSPTTFWKRMNQQYRYNRSFIRATFDWISEPNIIKNAKLGFIQQLMAIIFPFVIVVVWIEWFLHIIIGYSTLIPLNLIQIILLSVLTLTLTITLRELPILQRKEDIFILIIYSYYYSFVITIFNVISVLTMCKEKPNMIQYSRNG